MVKTNAETVTVTFNMSENVKEFLTCYSQLMKYPDLEAFLTEELQDYYKASTVADRTDYYFHEDIQMEILRRYSLLKQKGEKTK